MHPIKYDLTRQANGKVEVEDGERNTGCQMNLQSTMSNTG